jgi:hypothetical protein
VATLFLALVVLVAALFFAGPKAAVSLATALLTFTALFVLSRLHIFRQRNGAFLALAVVCLLGALVPLVENGLEALKTLASRAAVPPTLATDQSASAAQTPLLTQSFALTKPEGGKQVRVLKDSVVPIAGHSFLIKAGDSFPFLERKADEVTFAVRDLQVWLPANVVEVIDPDVVAQGVAGNRAESENAPLAPPAPSEASADDLASITMSAQREAIRRYPALAIQNSLENEAFVSTYQQLKESGGAEFFANPEWPIELAELLAKREGWARGGLPSSTGPASPAPVLDAPANLPPVDQLDAGIGLPQAP